MPRPSRSAHLIAYIGATDHCLTVQSSCTRFSGSHRDKPRKLSCETSPIFPNHLVSTPTVEGPGHPFRVQPYEMDATPAKVLLMISKGGTDGHVFGRYDQQS